MGTGCDVQQGVRRTTDELGKESTWATGSLECWEWFARTVWRSVRIKSKDIVRVCLLVARHVDRSRDIPCLVVTAIVLSLAGEDVRETRPMRRIRSHTFIPAGAF